MSVLDENSVFTSLNQRGPLAVRNSIETGSIFTPVTRRWVSELKKSRVSVTKYRALRSQLFEFLNITSYKGLKKLITNQKARDKCSSRGYTLLTNMFGIQGTEPEIKFRVNEYARTADAVINSLKSKIFAPYASHVAITNEVEIATDPVDLLLMIFDDRYHKKARFEAQRKLSLMSLAGSIDQRERELNIEEKFSLFLDFLNDHVWSRKQKIGEHDIAGFL